MKIKEIKDWALVLSFFLCIFLLIGMAIFWGSYDLEHSGFVKTNGPFPYTPTEFINLIEAPTTTEKLNNKLILDSYRQTISVVLRIYDVIPDHPKEPGFGYGNMGIGTIDRAIFYFPLSNEQALQLRKGQLIRIDGWIESIHWFYPDETNPYDYEFDLRGTVLGKP